VAGRLRDWHATPRAPEGGGAEAEAPPTEVASELDGSKAPPRSKEKWMNNRTAKRGTRGYVRRSAPPPPRVWNKSRTKYRDVVEAIEQLIEDEIFDEWVMLREKFRDGNVASSIRHMAPWVPSPPKGRMYEATIRKENGQFRMYMRIVKAKRT